MPLNLKILLTFVLPSIITARNAAPTIEEVPVDSGFNQNENKGAPKQYRMTDEARDKTLKATADVGKIAYAIKCTVCEQASANISAIWPKKVFSSEFDVVDYFDKFCAFGDNFVDHLVKAKHWQLREAPKLNKGQFALEPPTAVEAKKGEEKQLKKQAGQVDEEEHWNDVRLLYSVQRACELTVKESGSELSDILYNRHAAGISESELSKKMCVELSSACKKPKGKKSRKIDA